MKEYVLGFAFDEKNENVVLIEKQKPEWQRGLHNGIGGKVEPSDGSNYVAMHREFKEETGLHSLPISWYQFATMTFENDILGGGAIVYCFKMFSDRIFQCKTTEQEEIRIFNVNEVDNIKTVPHLKILISLALDKTIKGVVELNMM